MFRTETPKTLPNKEKKHDQNLHNNYISYNSQAGHIFFSMILIKIHTRLITIRSPDLTDEK